jgi:hypothetical protein
MRRTYIGLTLAAALSMPVALRAQACIGLPAFAGAPIRVQGGGNFGKGFKAYSGGIGAGAPSGLFMDAGYARVTYDDITGGTNQVFAEAGFQVPVGTSGAQICPVAGGGFGMGPDDITEPGEKNTATFATAGLALGMPVAAGPGLHLIPNVSVRYEYDRLKSDRGADGSDITKENSGVVDVGLGLLFGRRLTIQPTVQFPFGITDSETTYGVLLSFGLGSGSRR